MSFARPLSLTALLQVQTMEKVFARRRRFLHIFLALISGGNICPLPQTLPSLSSSSPCPLAIITNAFLYKHLPYSLLPLPPLFRPPSTCSNAMISVFHRAISQNYDFAMRRGSAAIVSWKRATTFLVIL